MVLGSLRTFDWVGWRLPHSTHSLSRRAEHVDAHSSTSRFHSRSFRAISLRLSCDFLDDRARRRIDRFDRRRIFRGVGFPCLQWRTAPNRHSGGMVEPHWRAFVQRNRARNITANRADSNRVLHIVCQHRQQSHYLEFGCQHHCEFLICNNVPLLLFITEHRVDSSRGVVQDHNSPGPIWRSCIHHFGI